MQVLLTPRGRIIFESNEYFYQKKYPELSIIFYIEKVRDGKCKFQKIKIFLYGCYYITQITQSDLHNMSSMKFLAMKTIIESDIKPAAVALHEFGSTLNQLENHFFYMSNMLLTQNLDPTCGFITRREGGTQGVCSENKSL